MVACTKNNLLRCLIYSMKINHLLTSLLSLCTGTLLCFLYLNSCEDFGFTCSRLLSHLYALITPNRISNNILRGMATYTNEMDCKTRKCGEPKIILFWTKFFGGQHPFVTELLSNNTENENRVPCSKTDCPCFLTDDRSLLANSSAVLLHMADLQLNDLPSTRSPTQRFIFFFVESPMTLDLTRTLRKLHGYFNWTLTYRLDSDFFSDFYLKHYKPIIFENPAQLSEDVERRQNRAIGFISHCHTGSLREEYINELRDYFPVDIYGHCFNLTCDKWTAKCDEKVIGYKFYLAFENSICQDYVTEKAMRAYNFGAVPIIMARGRYRELFPPHSFISLSDFKSAKELADYLNYLVSNRTAYESYLQWKLDEKYMVVPRQFQNYNVGLCQVCKRLHDINIVPESVINVYRWWIYKGQCVSFRKFLSNKS